MLGVLSAADERAGAPDGAVQQFMAYGQLCHLIVAVGLTDLTDVGGSKPRWAKVLTEGTAHPETTQADPGPDPDPDPDPEPTA
ncbi:hypothetical protein [Streptomyces sp. NBC_00878]|uniref:hypothetical protein n=1 Tax=Streptomyces sp. NBC_00878 TaxID=2975854 RepID=UPI00224DF588|nr:hypothetical protein [Streptomyces sp. NBC_00878]MCX4905516.1 hypothetical protein [Streptomyces sp. NBC_00878]